jgi:uncharacterized protein YciW
VVSVANGYIYCQTHHGAALNAYWKHEERIKPLMNDNHLASLSQRELALCDFAVHLTKHPAVHEMTNRTEQLREAGLTDESIFDAALVTSYYNFVNRMVLSLGVQLEAHKGRVTIIKFRRYQILSMAIIKFIFIKLFYVGMLLSAIVFKVEANNMQLW